MENSTPSSATEKTSQVTPSRSIKWVLIIIIVLLVGIPGILFYLSQSNQKTTNTQQSQSIIAPSPIPSTIQTSVSQRAKLLPRLAYVVNSSEDVRVFILNADGTEKKQIAKFSKKKINKVNFSVVFSPKTNEIIVNTNDAVIAVNIKTGEQKQVYNKGVYTFWITNTFDAIHFEDPRGGPHYAVDVRNHSRSTLNQCSHRNQPAYDQKSSKVIEAEILQESPLGNGNEVPKYKGSTIKVCDLNNDTKYNFTYTASGAANPLFMADRYLYFTTETCCASNSSLASIRRMNLYNGQVSALSNFPDFQKLIEYATYQSNGAFGDHFLFTVNKEEKKSMYDLNIRTGDITLVKDNVKEDYFSINWSSDGRFVLFNDIGKNEINIYDYQEKRLDTFLVPSGRYALLNTNRSQASPLVTPIALPGVDQKVAQEISGDINSDPNIQVSIQKVEGDFAKGVFLSLLSNAHAEKEGLPPRAGNIWIAVKQEGKWSVVVEGNGFPSCSEVSKYAIPQSIYYECVSSN